VSETRRLFFALWPDRLQRDRLRDIVNSEAKHLEGRAVDRGNWHVTLAFIGNSAASLVPVLLARAAELSVSPFRLRFDRIEYWARPRVACLVPSTVPVELDALHDALTALLVDLGYDAEQHGYRPHVTLVRAARPFATERLARPATFEFDGFELVESVSLPGGVRYVPLKQ
jgi:2'-5' RNA ligase